MRIDSIQLIGSDLDFLYVRTKTLREVLNTNNRSSREEVKFFAIDSIIRAFTSCGGGFSFLIFAEVISAISLGD